MEIHMRVVRSRSSSLEEYASWYLRRDVRKGGSCPILDEPREHIRTMWHHHADKMRHWFNAGTRWSVLLLDVIDDFSKLVFLESPWTKQEGLTVPIGLNYRILDRIADNAMACNYLARPSAQRHKTYYDRLASGSCRLEGEDRIAICSAELTEVCQNPVARYYLLDGVGRCLPYMILVKEGKLNYAPVEAFLAERAAV